MATTYINTGVVGQYLGGTLTSAPVGGQFQEFAAEVQRKKRKLSGPTQAEREAIRQRREERRQASIAETALVSRDPVTDELVTERPGVEVDTADVRVPDVPARTQQEAAQVAAAPPPAPTITKAPVTVRTPAPAPRQQVIAPERQFGATDVAFAQAFDAYYQSVQGKNVSDVRAGRGALQSQYQAAVEAARTSGRQEYIDIVTRAGAGVAGQKHISTQNIGQAKAATQSARTAIRGLVDLDTILKQNPLAAPGATTAAQTAVSVRNARGRVLRTDVGGGRFFRRGR